MEEKKSLKKKIIADTVLLLCLLCVVIVLFFILRTEKNVGASVRVTIGGDDAPVPVSEYSLGYDAEYSLNGGTNILVIKDGEAYIANADCPDKICVHSGKIKYIGERIVCLPNKLMIEVTGDGIFDFVS